MKKTITALFATLRSAMTGKEMIAEERTLCTKETLAPLFSLAQKHDLAHLVAEGLEKNGLLDKESKEGKAFLQARVKAVYRHEQLYYEYCEICETLRKEGISFIPLKGAVLRAYYPQPWMRTSCDIDILIQEENLERAIAAIKENGYVFKGRDYHDVSLFSPAGIHLELHFSLLEGQENIDRVLAKVWSFVKEKEGLEREFTKEYFLFYAFAHASYHFLFGGCGLRTLIDIWVIKKKMDGAYTEAKALLEEAEIYTFAKELDALCAYCFLGGEETELTQSMLEYIVNGGTYGTLENRVAIQGASQSGFGYLWKRFFPPYRMMKEYYKILKKVPILLPFCWVARWVRTIFRGNGKRAMNEIKTANQVAKEKNLDLQSLSNRLGLQGAAQSVQKEGESNVAE